MVTFIFVTFSSVARLAQSVERKTLNLVVVGSSPTVGDCVFEPKASFSLFLLKKKVLLLLLFLLSLELGRK
jgi:hypothetical protein